MKLVTGPGEPVAEAWRVVSLRALGEDLAGDGRSRRRGPRIVAVDGRSGSGKTTFAVRLRDTVPGAVVVHSDDVAWHHSMFGWDDLLRDGVLAPLRRGEDVAYRPPAWDERGREGAVVVAADARVVLVEGVGVGRRSLAPSLDALVWVQSDTILARERGLHRDVANGRDDDTAQDFWDEWEAEEVPFLERDRPWERADVVVLGNAPVPDHDVGTQVVVSGGGLRA